VIAIYTLSDPRNNAVRYVGQTRDPNTRLCGHYTNPTGMKWIDEIKSHGIRPNMNIIEWVEDDVANAKERYWIRKLKSAGCDLANKSHLADTDFKSAKIPAHLHAEIRVISAKCGESFQLTLERLVKLGIRSAKAKAPKA